ncbi:MAG: alpha/beta hydrolase [Shewanella sp.]
MAGLQLLAGPSALTQLREQGLQPQLFSQMLAASGGPKFLGLAKLDDYLFSDFFNDRTTPLHTLGSSSGAWRLACLAQNDSRSAYNRLVDAYIDQSYSARPSRQEVTCKVNSLVSHFLGDNGASEIINNPYIHHHIVVCRAKHLNASRHKSLQALGLSFAAMTNLVHRRLLNHSFERVLVSPPQHEYQAFSQVDDLNSIQAHYHSDNLNQVLLASGSIPLLLDGVRGIKHLPAGQYFDGGISDYHFKLKLALAEGLTLYPHFYPHMSPGWFDKSLPWRRHAKAFDRALVLAPSREFIERLPLHKLPDRTDFSQLDTATRLRYWRQSVAQSQQLADEFHEAVTQQKFSIEPLL